MTVLGQQTTGDLLTNEQIFNLPLYSLKESQSSGKAQTPLVFVAVEMHESPSLAVNNVGSVGKLMDIFMAKQ